MRAASVCAPTSVALAAALLFIPLSAQAGPEETGAVGPARPEPASEAGPAGSAQAGGSVSLEGGQAEGSTKGSGGLRWRRLSKRRDRKWIDRWAPERNMVELGVFGGVLFPAPDIELFEDDPNLPRRGFKTLQVAAFEVGGRVGYYPLRYLGLEVEGAYAPTSTEDDGQAVNLFAARGHVVGQLGWWSVTPFVLLGGGVLGAVSDRTAVGNDVDAALHFGLGAKAYINRYVQARLELRDTITARRGVDEGATNNLELLLGVSVTLGRKKDVDQPPVADRDEDGFVDSQDACPDEPGVSPYGCPIRDSDGDGFMDPEDKCPQEPGVAPDGCPIGDRDEDGFPDDVDACPDEPGIEPDGCPDLDPDKDGILDPDDKCPTEPETKNGFEDEDGCPDEVPAELQAFAGTLEGVYFEVNKAVLRPQSKAKLDETVEVLKKYPDTRIEISGHTDSTGPREHNMELSQQRAEAVKTYLVEHGIDAGRIETRGAGPDEPIDTNATREGRSKNRRIEFRILD